MFLYPDALPSFKRYVENVRMVEPLHRRVVSVLKPQSEPKTRVKYIGVMSYLNYICFLSTQINMGTFYNGPV